MSDRRHAVGRQSCDADFTDWYTVDAKIENGILVLEDINEHPFRVERMLLQLYHAGILPRQKAIILGSFSGSTPNDYDAGYSTESVYAFCVPACRFHSLPASILVMNNARLRCRWAHMPF